MKISIVLSILCASAYFFVGCNAIDLSLQTEPSLVPTSSPTLIPGSTSPATVATLPTITDTVTPQTPPITSKTVTHLNQSIFTLSPTLEKPETATPTSSTSRIRIHCLEPGKLSVSDLPVQSLLVVFGQYPYSSLSLTNLQTGEKIYFPIDEFDELSRHVVISPNNDRLAYTVLYFDKETHIFKIQKTFLGDKDGNVKVILEDETYSWFGPLSWIDEFNLEFHRSGDHPDTNRVITDYLTIFNPFGGSTRDFYKDDYILSEWVEPSLGEGVHLSIDPAQNYLVHPEIKIEKEIDYPGLSLIDIASGQEISFLKDARYPIAWSPNGDVLAVVRNVQGGGFLETNFQEIYIMGNEGQVEQLTFITKEFLHSKIGNINWSPDGRYLAFSLHTLAYEDRPKEYSPEIEKIGYRLAILDTETMVVTDYCFKITRNSPLIWSPDGDYLVVGQYQEEEYIEPQYLVEIKKGFVFPLIEERYKSAVGWIKK